MSEQRGWLVVQRLGWLSDWWTPDGWTSNPSHAVVFADQASAELVAAHARRMILGTTTIEVEPLREEMAGE